MELIELYHKPQARHQPLIPATADSTEDDTLVNQYIDSINTISRSNNAVKLYYDQLVDYLSERGGPQQVIREFDILYSERAPFANGDLSTCYNGSNTQLKGPRVVVLEGFPSPRRIGRLGVTYQLSAEFFIGNLDFSQKVIHGTAYPYYEMPALPSASQHAIHFRFVSLGSVSSGSYTGQPTEYQKTLNTRCRQNQTNLFDANLHGTTRWRQVQIHGLRHWSLEQVLSFTVSSQSGSWTGVFLADLGRSDDGSFDGMPWHHGGCEKDERPAGTIPLIGSCPTSNSLVASSSTKTSASELDQFHPLKRIHFTDATDYSLYREDPFYLYHSILRTMLDSWTQLINFLETDIETSRSASANAFGHSLEQLRLTSTMLYRARNTILEHLPVVKLGGHNQWPKCEAFELRARKSALQQELELAINSLVGRYSNLLHECQTVSQLLVSSTQVVESQKAIQQSKEVNALTQLAFTFVPGSFIAAIFSMSVRELSIHPPGIWVFFATALPVMLIFSLLTIKAIRRPFFGAAHSAREKLRGAIKRDGFGFER